MGRSFGFAGISVAGKCRTTPVFHSVGLRVDCMGPRFVEDTLSDGEPLEKRPRKRETLIRNLGERNSRAACEYKPRRCASANLRGCSHISRQHSSKEVSQSDIVSECLCCR